MKIFFYLFLLIGINSCKNTTDNMDNNFSPYPRVRVAHAQKGEQVKTFLSNKSIDFKQLNIFIRAFKQEKTVEIWAKNKTDETYQLITTYDICKSSGKLGPKRKEGDYQVPEGGYYIDRMNPKSSYHLSLGINYPNISDKILGDKSKPGSDIFIHGECVTVGCLPMTNDKIKEIYLFAEFAKRSGQEKIPVHIFPFHLKTENIQNSKADKNLKDFWRNLKILYDAFENSHIVPIISIDEQGKYHI